MINSFNGKVKLGGSRFELMHDIYAILHAFKESKLVDLEFIRHTIDTMEMSDEELKADNERMRNEIAKTCEENGIDAGFLDDILGRIDELKKELVDEVKNDDEHDDDNDNDTFKSIFGDIL